MYVVLEGIDGVGKSTHTNLLEKYYKSKDIETKRIVEPTNSQVGQLLRQELKNEDSVKDTNQQMLALLFAADRLTQKDEILKYVSDIFDVEMETSYEFKELHGLTFVFIRKILSFRNRISSAEIMPAGIIYEENGEYYFAPLYDVDNIEEIVKEFVKNCMMK
jgi:hypothetical protein